MNKNKENDKMRLVKALYDLENAIDETVRSLHVLKMKIVEARETFEKDS